MIPVYQYTWNDCFHACVASILEIPLAGMPYYVNGTPTHRILRPRSRWNVWARLNGYEISCIYWPLLRELPIDEYYIGCYAYTEHGGGHAVVCMNNEIVHDPRTRPQDSPYYNMPYTIVQFKEVR